MSGLGSSISILSLSFHRNNKEKLTNTVNYDEKTIWKLCVVQRIALYTKIDTVVCTTITVLYTRNPNEVFFSKKEFNGTEIFRFLNCRRKK